MADTIAKAAPLPSVETPPALEQAVRAFATRAVDLAWQRLEEEVQVQTLVWKSIAVSKKGGMGAIEQALRLHLQAVQRELAAGDRATGLRRVEDILKMHGGCLSTSMLKTLQNIIRQTGLTTARQQLAARLAAMAATTKKDTVETEAKSEELLQQLVRCRLSKSLDSKVREAYQLPPREEPSASKENQAEVKEEVDLEFKPLVIATPSRTLYEVVGMEAAIGPRVSNRSVGSVVNANWSIASVGGAVGAKPTFSNRSTLSTLSTKSARGPTQSEWQPLSQEASAAKLRSMASANPPAMWRKLQSEFDTQKLVWESVALTKKKGTKTADRIEVLQGSIDRLLALSREGHSEQEALQALEQLLTRAEDVKLLNASISETCRDVLKQQSLAPQRRALAQKLDVAGVAATLPRTEDDKQQLEELVQACDLDGDQLNYSVRKWLLLPLPKDLEAALATAGKLFLGQTIGTRASRKLSNKAIVGGAASRKDSLRSGGGGLAAVEVIPEGAKELGSLVL